MGSALLDTTDLDPAFFEAAGSLHAAPAASRPEPHDALKLQVAQRLAAHRDRRDRLRAQPAPRPSLAPLSDAQPTLTRANRIAAAVAERYAQSPTYRAFLAAEAERAIQQAHAAAEVAARNAQAVAHAQQQLLDAFDDALRLDLEEALDPQPATPTPELSFRPEPQSGVLERPATSTAAASASAQSLFGEIEDHADTRAHTTKPRMARTTPANRAVAQTADAATLPAAGLTVRLYQDRAPEIALPASSHLAFESAAAKRKSNREDHQNEAETRALDEEIAFRHAPIFEEPAGPTLPLPANLIEFPRQLIASRKARPRCAEGPLREDDIPAPGGSQLRIFEVDPAQISTTPEPAEAPTPQWTSIWLDTTQAAPESTTASVKPSLRPWELTHLDPTLASYASPNPRPQTATISCRLKAAAIDGGIILAAFAAFAATFTLISLHSATASASSTLPEIFARAAQQPTAALTAITVALAFLYLLYQTLFFSFSEATPGMRIARIALCTFADDNPTRPAMRRRILAVMLSTCSLGLGFFWAAFDKDRLAWHDLISRMYQRSY